MKEIKASTAKGKEIIERGSQREGCTLSDVYVKWSVDKQKAYDWCRNEYLKTENSMLFAICSHNTFGFTCSWIGTKYGEKIMRYETKDNSYLVWLER